MTGVLEVVEDGQQWGIRVDGEMLALAGTPEAAMTLAHDAAKILRRSGADVIVEAPRERRSFTRQPEEPA